MALLGDRFECRLAPEAPCEVTWYLNERALQPGRDFEFESLEDGTQRLTVLQAFPDDGGVLTCEAESERGVATTSTQLLVESVPGEYRDGEAARSRLNVNGSGVGILKYFDVVHGAGVTIQPCFISLIAIMLDPSI